MSTELESTIRDEFARLTPESFQPTEDINLVWVVSGPGTLYENVTEGIYKDRSPDRERVFAGVDLVHEITALRLGKQPNEVTIADIEAHGPLLFYAGPAGENNSQYEAMMRAIREQVYEMSSSKTVVKKIDKDDLPSKVDALAKYLQTHPYIKKVAVVTHQPNNVTVAHCLETHSEIFNRVTFEDASIMENLVMGEAVEQEMNLLLGLIATSAAAETPLY